MIRTGEKRQLARKNANVRGDSSAELLGAFALLALLLASIGLYGVLSYAVTQRTNEIGVRMALGATSRDILFSFGRRGLVWTLAGLAIGLVLAAIAVRLMTALLYGFQTGYLPMVALVSLILLSWPTFEDVGSPIDTPGITGYQSAWDHQLRLLLREWNIDHEKSVVIGILPEPGEKFGKFFTEFFTKDTKNRRRTPFFA